MKNSLAWVFLVIGIAIVVIGFRGTAHNMFPWLPSFGGSNLISNTGPGPSQSGVQQKSDATGGISGGAGYSIGQESSQPQCIASGGIWYNGQCRHFSGAGANK